MTTIACDGKTLAGDKQVTTGGTATLTTKVFKVKTKKGTVLAGYSGDLADGQAFIEWLKKGENELPDMSVLNALVIKKNGSVKVYHDAQKGRAADMGTLDMWALGSGCDYALGAMKFGATAKEAIEIASELDVNTGLGVDVVSFS